MSNVRYFVCTLLGMILVMSCCRIKENISNASYKVDLGANIAPSFYDYFSKIEIIPLETSEKSLIKYVAERVYHNGKYYILDRPQRKLLVFDKKGNFLYDINKYGNGPGEYTELYGFYNNPFTGGIDLLSPLGGILRYDSLGQKFKEKISLPLTVPAIHQFVALNKDTYLFFCESREGKKMIQYDINQRRIVSEVYDIPEYIFNKTFYHHTYSPFYVLDNKVHFVQSYNGDVFTFENKSLLPKYHWDFGEQNFDIKELKDESIDYYFKYARTIGAKYANAFVSYGENSRYYISGFSYNNKLMTLIYDKQANKTVAFNAFKEGHQCIPSYVDESGVYLIGTNPIWSLETLNADALDTDTKEVFNSITAEDNPIVIKYVFK